MGSPHTNTIVVAAEIESGFDAKDGMVPFRCSPVPSSVASLQLEKTQGPLVKKLSGSEWRSMKQLAVRVHFVRCGGLLDDWSTESVLSFVFV
ncbi:hypothetical protein TNCV_74361 [Trichonephila clavipes]|nr:hypothetical protein TNCV_74361 [Trichonephila clavipes]